MVKDSKKINVIVIMSSFHVGGNILLNKLVKDPNIIISSIIVKDPWNNRRSKNKNLLIGSYKALVKWGSKVGYFFIMGIAIMVILHFFNILLVEVLLLGLLFKNRNFLKSTRGVAKFYKIPVYTSFDINDQETLEFIEANKPDVIVCNYFNQILSESLIKIPKISCINLHPGRLPKYRGLFPHFWNMVYKEKMAGVTLHYIDSGVDTGDIISEETIKINYKESFYRLWHRTGTAGYKLLNNYFKKLRKNREIIPKKNDADKSGKFYPFPNKAAYSKFSKLGHRLYDIKDFSSTGK